MASTSSRLRARKQKWCSPARSWSNRLRSAPGDAPRTRMPVRLPMQYTMSSARMSVCIPRNPQSFSQKGTQRAGSFTVSWMCAMPFSSTLMGSPSRRYLMPTTMES